MRVRRVTGRSGHVCALIVGLLCAAAHASVAVLLEQPYGNLGHFYPAGHSAIYLDHVCADGPTKLRACGPGELGVVLSRYDGVAGLDWAAMPLTAYLYSVETAAEIPGSMDKAGEAAIRDAYRRAHLLALAPDAADGTAPDGNWYELIGAAYDRTIYGFSVKTTAGQDAALIADFNDRKNVQRYNGFFNNCADFSRSIVNRFYPHAVRRNYIADLGMTSPKSVVRSLAHFAKKHPEAEMQVFVIPQVEGALPRSHAAVDLAEGILKRYSVPLTVLSPETTAVVLLAYVGHGRFAMPRDAMVIDLQDPATMAFLTGVPAAERDGGQVEEPVGTFTAGSVD